MHKLNLSLVIILLSILPLFFFGGPDHYAARSLKELWNFGHIIFFAIAAYLFLFWSNARFPKRFLWQLFAVLSGSILFGVTIEFIQYGLSRNPDYQDLIRNVLGALLGLLWFLSVSREKTPRSRVTKRTWFTLALVVFVGLVGQFYTLALVVLDEWRARTDFPVLADFESPMEQGRWGGGAVYELSQNFASGGSSSLKIKLGTQQYSGVGLKYFPCDWRGYDQLNFDVFNSEAEPIKLTLRIHDNNHRQQKQRYSDRFNRSFIVLPGKNSIEVDLVDVQAAPETRTLDLSAVQGVGMFTVSSPREKIIYLDNLRLTKVK